MELGFIAPAKIETNLLRETSGTRAEHEVQASYIIAKRFPRDQLASYTQILDACKRPFLAEQAMYAYPKAGTLVTGASIRLAEVLAQAWGNLDCGVRELSQNNGISVAEAYAIDLQTNSRVTKVFHVKHERGTKAGVKRVTDPREVYELVANNGARRLRACILAIIPSDVVEAAIEQCRKTMLDGHKEPIADRIRKLVQVFSEVGVKVEHLEKRLGHKLDAVIPTELVTLGSIYKSIRDGMAGRDEFFDIGMPKSVGNLETLLEAKNNITTNEVKKDGTAS